MKFAIREPLMDEEQETYQYEGGKGKKAKKGAKEGEDDGEVTCESIVPGGKTGVRLIGVCAILCIGIFFLSYFMRQNAGADKPAIDGAPDTGVETSNSTDITTD